MSEMYTPDAHNVRAAWIATGIGSEDALSAEFDRWLAREREAAYARGWRDCATAIQDGLGAWDATEHYGTEEDRHVDQ